MLVRPLANWTLGGIWIDFAFSQVEDVRMFLVDVGYEQKTLVV